MRFRIHRIYAVAALMVLLPSHAAAQTMPRFDVERHCREVSIFAGGSNQIYNGCVDMEQEAYDKLRAQWTAMPAQTRTHCANVAEFGGGSYSILEGCIEMELDAGENTSTFKY